MPRKPFDIVVVGGINMDYLVCGKTLPKPGETVVGQRFFQGPGGKGANQAVAAARLGARVALIGRIGKDAAGRSMLASLRTDGVDTSAVSRDPSAHSGVALIVVDASGEKQISAAPGANLNLTVPDIWDYRNLIAEAKILLLQLEVSIPVNMEAARIANKAGVRVVLDPAPPAAIPRELYKLLTVIRPNSSEAEFLTGVKVCDPTTARAAAKKLMSKGAQTVALQAGEEGDLLVWREGEKFLPRLEVKSVDATGAGDAFAAGLAVGLSEGLTFAEAGRIANATAALATTKVGAQEGLPSRREVEALLKKNVQ
jgi:ribokinase